MTRSPMRYVASAVRKAPWTIGLARRVWRLRQPKFTAGVVGVVFDEQGRVLLVEHVFHPYTPWGLPGGWVDHDENPGETIRREMREELQLTVEVGPALLVEVDCGNHLDLAYLCYKVDSVGKLNRELLGYGWYQPSNMPRLHPFHYHAILRAQDWHKTIISA